MGISDLLFEGVTTAADIEQIKRRYEQDTADLMENMAGNEGQRVLTSRYSGQVSGYINSVAYNWDEHVWFNWIDKITVNTSESGVYGTIVILSSGFQMVSAMIGEIQSTIAQSIADLALDGAGEDDEGGGRGFFSHNSGEAAKLKRKAQRLKSAMHGGDFTDLRGGFSSDWRHAHFSEQPDSMDDFVRRLRAPGLKGLKTRFEAGGTDAQLMLMFDGANHVERPLRLTNSDGTMGRTFVPSGRQYGRTAGRWVNDPSGAIYSGAENEYFAVLKQGEKTYQMAGGSMYDRTGAEVATPDWRRQYNPYTMQRQFYKGEFAGPMTWEGKAAPYGTFGGK